ncbi:P-II family nitrogen regulator [uncultured Methanoregula sp.]|uniref:P-II family nitrogen regulator n=1 Tax=uncultured Methanoregula sp. TaxID=1005933 RepID=UPI002AABD367|nr:P-II family nitrogen regulator [uncultured Methanoregula sp.]
MKMIWAVIRPESTQRVVNALDAAGIAGMTRLHVTGHGKEMGITFGAVHYTEIPKEMLMIVVPDGKVAKTVSIIRAEAKTREKNKPDEGTIGDGKIFITYVEDNFAIRTAGKAGGT